MKYSNVLIEKEHAGIIQREFRRYPVLLDHKPTVQNLVGMVEELREENGELFATIKTFGNRDIKGLFPSVGIQVLERERERDSAAPGKITKAKLYALGVTATENMDPTIPPIGEPDEE